MRKAIILTLLMLVCQAGSAGAADAPVLTERQLGEILSLRMTEFRTDRVAITTIAKTKYFCVVSESTNVLKDSDATLQNRLSSKGKAILFQHLKKDDPALIEITLSRWQGSRIQQHNEKFAYLGCVAVDSVQKSYLPRDKGKHEGESISDHLSSAQYQKYESELLAKLSNDTNNIAILEELLEIYRAQGDVAKASATESRIMRVKFKTMD